MTQTAYYDDSYAQTLAATVTAVAGEWVTLDQTLFYPRGGGQPGDTGLFITTGGLELAVADTRKGEAGAINHQMADPDHGLQSGDAIQITLDWERRYRHMRMHTCLHLLGSVIPAGVTGGAIAEHKSRLDFDMGDETLDKEQLTQRLNTLVEAGHAVEISHVDEAVLDSQPELVRTMSVAPPRGVGRLRMVRIVDVDYQPCGGTHVRNTAEIGAVRISKIQNKGKHNRRVHVVFDT